LKLSYSYVFAVTVVCLGCGGGSGTRAGLGVGTTSTVGEARFTATGTPQDQTLAFEGGVSISSVAGASISSFEIFPAANLNNAPLYFVNDGALYSYCRGQVQLVYVSPAHYIYEADVSSDGKIYMNTLDPSSGYVFAKCNLDGTGYSVLVTGLDFDCDIHVSRDGSKIVYDYGNSNVTDANSDGTSPITIDENGYEGQFSPDGTKVSYVGAGDYQIWTESAQGGRSKQLTNTRSYQNYEPTYSPDGSTIICDLFPGGNSVGIGAYAAYGGTQGYPENFFSINVPDAYGPCVSPDGKYIGFLTSTSLNGPSSAAFQDLGGNSLTTIAPANEVIWPSYPVPKTFIGAGGAWYTSAAAGFLYSSYQPGFASLLAFTATTPSTATAKVTSGTGTGPVIYDLKANSITGLKYANGYFNAPVSITPSTTDVLVSIDSTTGAITAVAPFVAVRGSSFSESSGVGTVSCSAHFTGIWDAHGKNLAPAGASVLTLDTKKGGVVSVR